LYLEDIKKPAVAGYALECGSALFAFFRVRLSRDDITGLYDHPRDGLVRGKGAAAVNVLALMIALLGRLAQVAAGASVGHVTA
jgi:hypothetical protein